MEKIRENSRESSRDNNCKNNKEHSSSCSVHLTSGHLPGRNSNLVSRWREQRRLIQGNFRQTVSLSLQDAGEADIGNLLQSLSADLIDYISIGHFRIYPGTESYCRQTRTEDSDAAAAWNGQRLVLQVICRHIGQSTDQVLAFNDSIETLSEARKSTGISAELVRLYRSLSIRFALEEQLLELLGNPTATSALPVPAKAEPAVAGCCR